MLMNRHTTARRAAALAVTATALALTATVLAQAGTVLAADAATAAVRPTGVSQGDPFATCTVGGTPDSTLNPGAEVEPDVAVDALRPSRIIGVWQQDRWSDGGAHGIAATYSGDGGRSFRETVLPVDACAPGGLPYERASDPWVSFGPDGTAYANALAFDGTTPRNTVAAVVSRDGGRTWHGQTALINDTSLQFFNDKNSITADPRRPGTAYSVWDRLDQGPTGTQVLTGPAMLSVTRDGGRTWSPARVIVPTGHFEQTLGNVIVVDPRTGVLYDFYNDILAADPYQNQIISAVYTMVRSTDAGRTWSAPTPVAADTSVLDVDPNTGAVLRTGSGLPSAAVDPVTGQLYVAYEGSDFTGGQYDQIQLVTSANGGRAWSAPVRVSGAPASPGFTPTVAVTPTGAVGVTYYDLRTLTAGDTTTLPTSTWLAVSPRGGRHFDRERQIAPVFDWLTAPRAGGLFLGDYQGLAATPDGFRALFVTTTGSQPDNRTDVFTGGFPASTGFAPVGTASGPLAARAGTVTGPARRALPARLLSRS